MITDLDLTEMPTAANCAVRCYKMMLGAESVAILGTPENKLLAICAHGLSPALSKFIEGMEHPEAFTQCAGLQCVLGVGYVYASYRGADWLSKQPHVLRALQLVVRPVLLGELVGSLEVGS